MKNRLTELDFDDLSLYVINLENPEEEITGPRFLVYFDKGELTFGVNEIAEFKEEHVARMATLEYKLEKDEALFKVLREQPTIVIEDVDAAKVKHLTFMTEH